MFIKYCVFSKILIYFPGSVFSRCQCVYTRQAGRTPALQQNWQSSENSKNTIFNKHPVPNRGTDITNPKKRLFQIKDRLFENEEFLGITVPLFQMSGERAFLEFCP